MNTRTSELPVAGTTILFRGRFRVGRSRSPTLLVVSVGVQFGARGDSHLS
jgi:hypothetical protein